MAGPKPSHAYVALERHRQVRDLKAFASDLQRTVNMALPIIKDYRQVNVLSLSWSNDDMGVKETETELLDVLRKIYGFSVERFVIDANLKQSELAFKLQSKINNFANEWANGDSLLIYIYSGHAAVEDILGGAEYRIAGQTNNNGLTEPCLDWHAVTSTLKYCTADILYIIDTCYAGQLAVGQGPELLAAANWDSVAGSLIDTSFTRVLATQLKEIAGEPCTVSNLFAKIHRGALENKIAAVPLYVPHISKNSIVLQKLGKPGGQRQSQRNKPLQMEALEGTQSRVLITVRLKHDEGVPSVAGWKQWLGQNIPPSVDLSTITIEGLFDISSSLLLVAMPVEMWTQLPANDTAYGFVSYVRSGNRLLQQAGPLTHRPQLPGRENQSSGSPGGSSKRGLFSGHGSGSGAQHRRSESDGAVRGERL